MRQLLLLSLLAVQAPACFSQYHLSDLDLSEDVTQWFDAQMGLDGIGLIYGSYQAVNRDSYKSHPFCISKTWVKGDLTYRERSYKKVFMMYNCSEDYIIIRHPTEVSYHNQPVRLDPSSIGSVVIEGRFFSHIASGAYPNLTGYVENLYSGEQLRLVVKRKKVRQFDNAERAASYETDDKYYLLYKKKYYRVSNKKAFFRLFESSRASLKRYIRANSLVIKIGHDEDLIQLTKYCDSMSL